MHPKPAGMHDTLGDALMIEVEEFLAQVKVFKRRGTTCADLQRILVVGHGDALLGSQDGHTASSGLVHFSTPAEHHRMIVMLRRFEGAISELCCLVILGGLRRFFLLWRG